MKERLILEEQQILLHLAREAMEHAVKRERLPLLDRSALAPSLLEPGASFVTLTMGGQLRGCIGALEAHQPLADDVREHTVAAALDDPRFPPVTEDELSLIQIEISRLTRPLPLEYRDADDLQARLKPHVDGVILRDGLRSATFLPQVWEKIPAPADFLDNLCYKMGADHGYWRRKHLDVLVYQVEEFHE